jgi:hypothetical protein
VQAIDRPLRGAVDLRPIECRHVPDHRVGRDRALPSPGIGGALRGARRHAGHRHLLRFVSDHLDLDLDVDNDNDLDLDDHLELDDYLDLDDARVEHDDDHAPPLRRGLPRLSGELPARRDLYGRCAPGTVRLHSGSLTRHVRRVIGLTSAGRPSSASSDRRHGAADRF